MTEAYATVRVDARRWFRHWISLACLAVAVIGFMPTFFLPLAQGSFHTLPMIYLHGLLFFAWPVFFCVQTWFAASGRIMAHREWGVLGVAIATGMVFSVFIVDVIRLNQTPSEPPFVVMLHVTSMAFFAGCIAIALGNVRRPETHKRLMVLATVSILPAATGRWIAILSGPENIGRFLAREMTPQTLFMTFGPAAFASLLIVAAIAFDWRADRRVSPVYAIGLPVSLLLPALTLNGFVATPGWLAFVDWMRGLGG
jgi:hypothetical protein